MNLPPGIRFEFIPLAKMAIEAEKFLVFDLLLEHFNIGTNNFTDYYLRFKLIRSAIESRLPEADIRRYLTKFGANTVIGTDYLPPNTEFLNAAAANGYLQIIIDFKMSEVSEENLRTAFDCAVKNHHTEIGNFIIRLFKGLDFYRFGYLVQCCMEAKAYESLELLVATQFGTDLDAKAKAQILLPLTSVLSKLYI